MLEPERKSYRDAVRWGLLLAGVAVTGYRFPRVVHDLRQWHEALAIDPSAADVYRTNLIVDSVGIAVVLAIGLALFYAMRQRKKNQ